MLLSLLHCNCDLTIGATVSLAQSQYSVAENTKTLSVSIMMNATASEDVMVEVTISHGSAEGNASCNVTT